MHQKSTERFSNRVEDYVKYRPHYPKEMIQVLLNKYHLHPDQLVADIGVGTGISSLLFLEAGFRVIGIEPNMEMRDKARHLLQGHKSFKIMDATADGTLLDTGSVDIILCGQAFHWFDQSKTKAEFMRILKPAGLVLLVWNERLVQTAFEQAYEQLIINYGNAYLKVDHRNIQLEDIKKFFAPGLVSLETFENFQLFDYGGLEGRLLSSSYMPSRNDTAYPAMIKALKALFEQYQVQEKVRVNYDTKLFIGRF